MKMKNLCFIILFTFFSMSIGCTINLAKVKKTFNVVKEVEFHAPQKDAFTPYVFPKTVSAEKFKHGEYMLMARQVNYLYTAEMIPFYVGSFFGKGITNNEQALVLYEKLNKNYEKQYPVFQLDSPYQYQEVYDYFFKRSVIFISEDAKRVMCQSMINDGVLTYEYNGKTLNRELWNRRLEIFEGKELLYTNEEIDAETKKNYPIFISDALSNYYMFSLNNFFTYYNYTNPHHYIVDYTTNPPVKKIFKKGKGKEDENVLEISNDSKKILTRKGNTIKIYKLDELDELDVLDDTKLLNIIHIPENFVVTQFTKQDKLIGYMEFQSAVYFAHGQEPAEFYKEHVYTNDVYSIDIHTGQADYLGNYMIDPVVSPDGNYIAYTGGRMEHDIEEWMDEYNNLKEMKMGIYIKNLKNNEIVFYPIETGCDLMNWVDKKELEKLIKNTTP